MRPHRWQPTRLHLSWASPGKNTGVGCHFLLCLHCTVALYIDVIPFVCFCFSCPCFWCHVQKNHYQDQYEGGLPHDFSKNFMVRLYVQVFNLFFVICIWYKIVIQFHPFGNGCPVSLASFIEKISFKGSLNINFIKCLFFHMQRKLVFFFYLMGLLFYINFSILNCSFIFRVNIF